MKPFSARGFVHPSVILAIVILLLAVVLTPAKKYVYLAYSHAAFKIGIDTNNIASEKYVSWIKSQNQAQPNGQAIFLNRSVEATKVTQNPRTNNQAILGTQADDSKWIEVDLSEQALYMMENGNVKGRFLVSTGKWYPTPRGQWRIWTKLTSTRMAGGSKVLGTYYNLPNVPYTMYYDRGYGIHGAYWHNNFGNPMSHGCVNMKPEEAAIVFNWAQVGTRVIVRT
ncbi:MAG: L,D-transpeptidase [Candidatus Curtissbacteria bacterium]|nr:L,D-transpeptidase [Candidatus Curtissbacteria bacterium]